jgi:hypothetical protein
VVDDQGDLVSFKRKTGHAIRLARCVETIVHGVTALSHDLVAEPGWQIEETIGVDNKGAVALDLIDVGFPPSGGGLRPGMARQSSEGDSSSAACQEVAALS